MASLQDQLLKAGLGDKKKAKQINNEKRKKDKIRRKSKIVEKDEVKESVQAQLEAKKEKDRELNAQAKEEAEKREIVAQVRQMISINRLENFRGDVEFKFTDGSTIKQLLVREQIKNHLLENRLAIVRFEQGYEIIPLPVADKISQRDAESILYRADKYDEVKEQEDEEDWYADFEIPDDLTW